MTDQNMVGDNEASREQGIAEQAAIESGPGVVPVKPLPKVHAMRPIEVPRANPNADRTQQLADGILDRDAGEDYNPNTPEIVEANRARFEATNVKINQDHQQLEEQIVPVIAQVADEAKSAMNDPGHQAMLPEQEAHATVDPLATHAGKETAAAVPPQLQDASLSPEPQAKDSDVADVTGPAVPVQSNSLRKDD